jgi:hypothetical protein
MMDSLIDLILNPYRGPIGVWPGGPKYPASPGTARQARKWQDRSRYTPAECAVLRARRGVGRPPRPSVWEQVRRRD